MLNKISFLAINNETPKATKEVCTKQPAIKPKTTAKACVLPKRILCTKTKILSGPGEIAKAKTAKTNDIKISIFKIIDPK